MTKENPPAATRRDFLKIASQGLLYFSGLLGIAGLIRFLSYKPDPPPPDRFEVGEAANFPMNSHTILPDIPAILIHDQDGYRALSLVCTHLGCTVEMKIEEFSCPCHGSRYDMQGNVLHGPAVDPLPGLRVELGKDGKLTVFK